MGTISKPNTFSPNTTISSSDVNDNFDTIYNEFNGSISAANLATGAVVTAKIADDAVTVDKIADNAVTTSQILNGAVTANKLGTGATNTTVATSETTTSSSYVALATAGPAVTVTIGANGLALVSLYNHTSNSTASADNYMGVALSGANTVASTDNYALLRRASDASSGGFGASSAVILLTGLTAGSTTFTAQYRTNAGTATFKNRRLAVVPL